MANTHIEAASSLNIPVIQIHPDPPAAKDLAMAKLNEVAPETIQDTTTTPTSPRLFLLYGIIILQLAIFITELVIDWFTHSLLILTDSYHHLFNACNAILLVVCFKIANQSTVKNTFGWVRIEVLGMLTTITFIVALIFSLLIEGFLQLVHLHEISTPTNFNVLLIFGVWSLIVNIFYVLTINGVVTETKYKQTTRTERSFSTANCEPSTSKALTCSGLSLLKNHNHLEVVTPTPTNFELQPRTATSSSADSNNNKPKTAPTSSSDSPPASGCFLGSLFQGIFGPILILLSSAAIYCLESDGQYQYFDVNMADPFVGILTAVILCFTFFPQLKNTTLILMQTVPQNINIDIMKKEMLEKFSILQNVHELHIWRLTASNIVATCHIVLPRQSTASYTLLFESIRRFLSTQYGIEYVTIQPEFSNWNSTENSSEPDSTTASAVGENDCFMKCPKKSCDEEDCNGLTCCSAGSDLSTVMVHAHGHGHAH